MAANHAPRPTCLSSEAAECSRACSSGPSTAAAASTAKDSVCANPSRLAQLATTPQTASTMTIPDQDQELISTDTADSVPAIGVRVVRSTPEA